MSQIMSEQQEGDRRPQERDQAQAPREDPIVLGGAVERGRKVNKTKKTDENGKWKEGRKHVSRRNNIRQGETKEAEGFF